MLTKYLLSPIAWLVWFILSVAMTLPGLLWHLDYFSTYGPRFRQFFPIAAVLLLAGAAAYQYIRKQGWWRYEPYALGALLVLGLAAYQPRAVLIGLWIVTTAFALGRRTLKMSGFKLEGITEELALAWAAGIGELILLLFVLGLLHLYYPITFVLLLGLPCVKLWREVGRMFELLRGARARWASTPEFRSPLIGMLVFFLAVFIVFQIVVVLTPSLVFDALAYHLADARSYAASHALTPLPFQGNSYLPQGFEVLMAIGYSLGGQPAAQMIPLVFFILSMAAVFALARRLGLSHHGAFAGLALVAMIPFVHWEGSEVKNDFALAFFILCSLYACLRWKEHDNFRWIYLSAFFLACAFGIKHVALFAAIPLALIYLGAVRRQARPIRAAMGLALLFLIFGLYWQARTFALTGNPVYPYKLSQTVTPETVRYRSTPFRKFSRWISSPWLAQFDGSKTFESISPSPLGAALVFLLPVWLLARRKEWRKAENLALFFIGLYLLYWSFEYGLLRFAIAPLILLILFTAERFVRLYDSAPRFTRSILLTSLAYSAIVSLCVVTFLEIDSAQVKLLARQLDWPGYLRTWSAAYRPMEYLQRQAGPEDLILSVDDCQAAYAPDPEHFHGICSDLQLYPPEEIDAELRRRPYAFLLISKLVQFNPGLPPSYQDATYSVFRLAK